jgi:hypothetical protein
MRIDHAQEGSSKPQLQVKITWCLLLNADHAGQPVMIFNKKNSWNIVSFTGITCNTILRMIGRGSEAKLDQFCLSVVSLEHAVWANECQF